MCFRLLDMAHVASFSELLVFSTGVSIAASTAAVVALFYLAVEPYARRNWPDSLISWNRLLAGKLRDPLVASHGLAGFVGFFAGTAAIYLVNVAVSAAPLRPGAENLAALDSTAGFAASLLFAIGAAPALGMELLVLVMLLRLLLRRVWIADFVTAVLFSLFAGVAIDFSNPYRLAATLAVYLCMNYGRLWVLRRFGLLAVMAWWLMNSLHSATPKTTLASWYAGRMLVGIGIMIAIATWALWVILSARRRPGTESAQA
jgi:hypothetical protein